MEEKSELTTNTQESSLTMDEPGLAASWMGERVREQLIDANIERGNIDFKKSVRPEKDKESRMKKDIGLWIDRQEAILVILSEGEEEIRHIPSGSEKYSLYSGSAHVRTPEGLKGGPTLDPRDREYGVQLNKFYAEVISAVRGAASIQIFGPGEAKGELEMRIKRGKLNAYMPAIEAADRMSDQQILEKVREHFLTERAPVKSG